MDFSSSNLALVAYASVSSDGVLLQSSGFASCQNTSLGHYTLTLVNELAQQPTGEVYPDLLTISACGSGIAMTNAHHASATTIDVLTMNAAAAYANTSFTLLVLRPVIPAAS